MSARKRQPGESHLRFLAEVGVTTFFWGLWGYLAAPLLSLVLWYFGYRLFYEEMVGRAGYQAFIEQLENYGLAVLAMLLVTLAWVFWNRKRYGGIYNVRTHAIAPVSLMESAEVAGIAAGDLEHVRERRRMLLDFCERDRIILRDPASLPRLLAVPQHSRIS